MEESANAFGPVAVVVLTLCVAVPAPGQPGAAGAAAAAARLPRRCPTQQIVQFLQNAKVVKTKSIGKGVTGAIRATLSDGTLTHDAQIQTIDEKKRAEFSAGKVREFNFEDSWRFNVAAYRVDRLIGLGMVPVSVPRTWKSDRSAFTWWIDDVHDGRGGAPQGATQPPDSGIWNEQMQLVKLFDQLIANTDRNSGNLLIGTSWQVWAIDHTRAFRTQNTLRRRPTSALRPPGARRPEGLDEGRAQARDRRVRHAIIRLPACWPGAIRSSAIIEQGRAGRRVRPPPLTGPRHPSGRERGGATHVRSTADASGSSRPRPSAGGAFGMAAPRNATAAASPIATNGT